MYSKKISSSILRPGVGTLGSRYANLEQGTKNEKSRFGTSAPGMPAYHGDASPNMLAAPDTDTPRGAFFGMFEVLNELGAIRTKILRVRDTTSIQRQVEPQLASGQRVTVVFSNWNVETSQFDEISVSSPDEPSYFPSGGEFVRMELEGEHSNQCSLNPSTRLIVIHRPGQPPKTYEVNSVSRERNWNRWEGVPKEWRERWEKGEGVRNMPADNYSDKWKA